MKFEYLAGVTGIYFGFPFFGFYPSVRICIFDIHEFCLLRIKVMSRDLQGFYVSIIEVAALSFSFELGYQENIELA